jgi:predicted nuclease of predicted toxin-antitoxin system
MVVEGLRRRGVDVTTAYEAGLVAATDRRQIEYAQEAGRVVVTQDTDFLRLHAQGSRHSGIAFLRQGENPAKMLRMLALLYDLVSAEEMIGRVEYL